MKGTARKRRLAQRSQQRQIRRNLERGFRQLLEQLEKKEQKNSVAPPLPQKGRAKSTEPQALRLLPFSPIEDPTAEVIWATSVNRKMTMKKLMEEVKKVAREFVERSYVFFTIHETPSVDWELDFPVTRKSLMVLTSILLEFESTPDFMKHIAQIYDIINTPRSARARRAWMKDLQSVGI